MIAGNETSSENEDKNLQNHDFEKQKRKKDSVYKKAVKPFFENINW